MNTLAQYCMAIQDAFNVLAIDKDRRNFMITIELFDAMDLNVRTKTAEDQTIRLAEINAALNLFSERNWYPPVIREGSYMFPR